jgi:hypothetical protein
MECSNYSEHHTRVALRRLSYDSLLLFSHVVGNPARWADLNSALYEA